MDFKHITLENGLTLVAEVNSFAQSAAVGFFVKTGSRDETNEVSGVSHFLEHMMFKGTERLSAFEVNEAFDRTGAKFNAFTSEENTVYYAAVLPEMLEEVTGLWSELMRPSLRNDDFDMEKNVIKEEIAMYQDLPQFDVMDKCKELHFNPHPCGNSVLGTNESIDALSNQQMHDYFVNRYAPNNMVLAFCGNVDFDAMVSLAMEKCGSWVPSNCIRQTDDFTGSFQKKQEKKNSLNTRHICMMSPAYSAQNPKRFALSLLSMIIGDSTGSRYFWGLVDNAYAETACMQYEAMDGTGALYSYIRCPEENAAKVMGSVQTILDEIVRDGITETELNQAKNKVLSTVTIKCEIPMGRLLNLGMNWTYLEQYRSVTDDIEDIKKVTVDEVNDAVKQIRPSEFTCYTLIPEKGQTEI